MRRFPDVESGASTNAQSLTLREKGVESGATPGARTVNSDLPIERIESPSRLDVHLRGELRIEHAAALAAELRAVVARREPVRLDWSAAEHLDACILQLLAAFVAERRRGALALELVQARPGLGRYLELAGFAAHFAPAGGAA